MKNHRNDNGNTTYLPFVAIAVVALVVVVVAALVVVVAAAVLQ